MKRKHFCLYNAYIAAGSIAVFLVFSCATTNEAYRTIDAHVQRESYETALHELQRTHKKVYPKKNAVLLHLDRGMLAHYAGKFSESSKDLEAAEALIEKYYAKSVTQEIASYIANDNTKDYAGEEYENIYINIFNALNYYHQGSLEDALVEIRRVNEKLVDLEDKYHKAIERARKANKNGSGVTSDAEVNFNSSALARYLGALLYRADGRSDDARIDFVGIEQAYSSSPNVYPFPCPPAFRAQGSPGYETAPELAIPAGKARFNIIAFTGLSPYKEEESTIIPLPLPAPNHFARISLPRLVNRPSQVTRVAVSLYPVLQEGEAGDSPASAGEAVAFNLDLIEDMGLAAAETFKASYALTVVKSTMRSIIKQTAGAGISSIAEEYGGSALGLLAGIFTTIVNTASEQADIRVSRYLPRYAFAGGITVEPGRYRVRVQFADGVRYEKPVTIREGRLNLVEAFYLK
ncbi:MAG: hypothetical protein LBD20_06390 [Spirochaetaceae bacterium]|nr:hypothetical protein [Spirochaetaceae bacterium]